MSKTMRILMLAAENDALPGGKVGGIGDVIRDVPKALSNLGHNVTVLTPGYNAFSQLPGAKLIDQLSVTFAGAEEKLSLYKVPGRESVDRVTHWVLEHPLFAIGGTGQIYCHDAADRPFATDASKFALFSTAAAQLVADDALPGLDVVHLHDWHAALYAVLRRYDRSFTSLQAIRVVYTIHNLSLQGIRPLHGDLSCFYHWFPHLDMDESMLVDPRYNDCINLARAGINLSDRVHAVSPTYASEIQRPSQPELGFIGGEGLEHDLMRANHEGRLHGILNGAEYPEKSMPAPSRKQLYKLCLLAVQGLQSDEKTSHPANIVAEKRLQQWCDDPKPNGTLLTSIGRITNQKMDLLTARSALGVSALEAMLSSHCDSLRLLVLGSGDEHLEGFLSYAAERNTNMVFIAGYAEQLSDIIYAGGDLFLMPSSFEPCGISQMLAMRASQPCLAHGVGGLRDTVSDGETGFIFAGESREQQVAAMLEKVDHVLDLKTKQAKAWESIRYAAGKQRFLWRDTVLQYLEALYR